jgi:hypothetical protein
VGKPDATHPKATLNCPTWIRSLGEIRDQDIGDAATS